MEICRKPRVTYWGLGPSPYVVGRFNALVNRNNLTFEAWFNTRLLPNRNWDIVESEWQFKARYLSTTTLGRRSLQLPPVESMDGSIDLLVSGYSSPSFVIGHLVACSGVNRLGFRVLPTYDAWLKRTGPKELMKHYLFNSVDGAKVPGPDGASKAQKYGVPNFRIGQVTQSIDVDHYAAASYVDTHWREKTRGELGLRGCVFIYVGRMWSGKGLDYLADAYKGLLRQGVDTSLLMVGDGVDLALYQSKLRDTSNVKFVGFKQYREIPWYYALADALVFPTLGDPHGLVVEEAMAAGLPVICTDSAGDIHERVPQGEAGFVVPAADSTKLQERMLELARNEALRLRQGAYAARLVRGKGHEQWAADFECFVDQLLSYPPRRSVPRAISSMAGAAIIPFLGTRHVKIEQNQAYEEINKCSL